MYFGEKYHGRGLTVGVNSSIRSKIDFRNQPQNAMKSYISDFTNVGGVKIPKKGDRPKKIKQPK